MRKITVIFGDGKLQVTKAQYHDTNSITVVREGVPIHMTRHPSYLGLPWGHAWLVKRRKHCLQLSLSPSHSEWFLAMGISWPLVVPVLHRNSKVSQWKERFYPIAPPGKRISEWLKSTKTLFLNWLLQPRAWWITLLASHDLTRRPFLTILWGKVVEAGSGRGISCSRTTWNEFLMGKRHGNISKSLSFLVTPGLIWKLSTIIISTYLKTLKKLIYYYINML